MISRTGEEHYVNDRFIQRRETHSVIYREETEALVPLFCPVCDFVMRTQDDEHTYELWKCCSTCSNKWVYSNVERWKGGWRPTKDEAKSVDRMSITTTLTF